MDIKAIQALTEQDMLAVNQLIEQQLQSNVALVNQLGLYIVNSGGKRIRPILSILAAKALGHQGQDHIENCGRPYRLQYRRALHHASQNQCDRYPLRGCIIRELSTPP